MKTIPITFCMLALFCLVACTKDFTPGAGSSESSTNLFDFSTSKEVIVNLSYDLPYNTRVEIYTENPVSLDQYKNYVKDETMKPIAVGYTDANGHLRLPLRLAAMDSQIFVYSNSPGAPVLLSTKLGQNTEVTLTTADRVSPAASKASRAVTDTDTYWKNWADQRFSFRANPAWSWNAAGTPNYLLAEGIELSEQALTIISNTIPQGDDLDLRYVSQEEISISENAHVKLYFVSNSSARKNALTYYVYEGATPSQAEINSTLTVLFPNLSDEALKAGDGVELQYFDGSSWTSVFPANSKIGFVLLVDAWKNGNLAAQTPAMYSDKQFNRYDIPSLNSVFANRPQMAAFDAKGNFILTFEDLPWAQTPNSPNQGDFADDVFVLATDPETALPPVKPGVDPENPDYGMEIFFKGILAFEDNWPYKGDYDMNDVVVKYNSTTYMNTDYAVPAIIDDYTFLNNGGQYENGFCIEYNFPENAIKTLEVSATNGVAKPHLDTDPLLTKATLVLFDNAADIPAGTVFHVKIVFNTPIDMPFFQSAPYNPFITINDDGTLRKETHLVNYTPTLKANPIYFGYGNDLSVPEKRLYYVSAEAYPFAIDITDADSYNIPEETHPIDSVYPDFGKWVASGGKEYKDWYK